jgi:prepilin-type N-terminal cleavage/methylation domain-containing protein
MKLRKLHNHGFTIIELMIATTVFSLVLLLCSAGMIHVGRTYNKGVTTARTQEAARSIVDEISRAIQFSGGTIATTPANRTDGTPYVFCIDSQRYTAVTDRQLKDNPSGTTQLRNVLVSDNYPGCSSSTTPLGLTTTGFNISSVSGAKELLQPNMRLARLEVNSLGGNLYEVVIRVVYGNDDLLDPTHDKCQNVRAGTQFCAVSELRTVVQKRV